jgi:predicted extracellular nuclease
MSTTSLRLAALASAAVVAAGLTMLAPPAQAVSPNVVISEAYGGGGNSGAPYQNDFVELYNRGAAPVDLTGWAVQYRSATGTSAQVTALSGTLAPGSYYLVAEGAGAGNGSPLPAADASGSIAMSASNGVVLLTSTTTAYTATGNLVGAASPLVDAVGFGSTPTTYEGANTGVALTNSTSAQRNATGDDTDNNAADFDEATPTPKAGPAGSTTFTGSIAEIQGNSPTSPKAGMTATTSGVVTAAYTTGGLNGFYLQTAGSGGATDPTPDASDAIFVFVGAAHLDQIPAIGHTANVTGKVAEFNGLTELDASAAGGSVADGGPTTPIEPHTGLLPGSDCALPGSSCLTGAQLAADQEAHEGELWQPSGDFTVTDAYDGSAFGGDAWGTSSSSSMFGEIGLAADSTQPLVAPTEVVDAQDAAHIAERTAYNKAHQLVLDDASSITFWRPGVAGHGAGSTDIPFPWFTSDNPVRVGESVSFADPMIYPDRFGPRRLRPTPRGSDDGTSAGVDFSNNRPAGPAAVGGDIKLATFNVLNFFPTSAAAYVALDPANNSCTAFYDREDNPIAVNNCSPNGPRGAWDAANLARQRIKIVHAINAVDADVVSLEELENSAQFGLDRDDAISKLVAALNADAGSKRWKYVPSPLPENLPPLAEQDVIRTGFIYNPATVVPVGDPTVLVGSPAFANAREPLAQEFKAKGTSNAQGIGVVVNHFKSKGSGTPDPDGQGNSNVDRVAQANALLDFAAQFKASRGITRMYLVGDFNAYREEDPVQEIERGADDTVGTSDDWTALEDTFDGTESYSFSGLSGSLDHIFVNAAAQPDVTGVDVLDINAGESVFNLYSRYHYSVSDLYDPTTFYGASDHNPEVIGIKIPAKH